MGRVIICEGRDCEYFEEYYIVEKSGSDSYFPVIGLTEKYCRHPKVFKAVGVLELDKGVKLESLKKCPKE